MAKQKPKCAICNEANLDNSYGWVEELGLVHKICYHATQERNFERQEAPRSESDGQSVTVTGNVQRLKPEVKQ